MIDPLVKHRKPHHPERFVNGPILLLWLLLFALCVVFADPVALFFVANFQTDPRYDAVIRPIMLGITTLGMARLYLIPAFIFLGVFLYQRRGRPFSTLLAPLPALPLFGQIILILPPMLEAAKMTKIIIGHARPQTILDLPAAPAFWEQYYGFMGDDAFHGLPSGHTTTAVTMALLVARFYPRLAWLAYFVAGCVMLSRVLLLEHQISDVIGTVVFVMIMLPLLHRVWDILRNFIAKKYNHL